MASSRRPLVPLLPLALAVGLAACGGVDLPPPERAPVPRVSSGGFDPEELLQLLERACNQTDRMGYMACLADTFSFTPHAAVRFDHQTVDWAAWDRAREKEFIRRLFTPGRRVRAQLPARIVSRGVPRMDRAAWDVEYRLDVEGTAYAGTATLEMVRSGKTWYLRRWTDVLETSLESMPAPTSGALRAQFTR